MKRNKYGAKRHVATVGMQECRFDSMAEHRYAEWLERERKSGNILSWEHHPKRLDVHDPVTDVRLCWLNPDFLVETRHGNIEYHEVKGMATSLWRMKRRLLETFTPYAYVVVDAGRGWCATGSGVPLPFDERPTRRRRKKRAVAR